LGHCEYLRFKKALIQCPQKVFEAEFSIDTWLRNTLNLAQLRAFEEAIYGKVPVSY